MPAALRRGAPPPGGARRLDLPDIQGNIHRPYGRYGFPYARYFLFHIAEGGSAAGRWFVDQIRPQVTTAEPWASSRVPGADGLRPKPPVALNIAFTWTGLAALGLPTATLRQMPDEFIEGMARRKHVLGDLGDNDPACWDPVWREGVARRERRVHVWIGLCAQARESDGGPVEALERWTRWLQSLVAHWRAGGKVLLLEGHGRDGAGLWQDSAAIMARDPESGRLVPTAKEHFGFTDGISDPVFAGQGVLEEDAGAATGAGKLLASPPGVPRRWEPLATGEFLLGHPSEGQELARSSVPYGFMRNGTFMALRKLHQNTGRFAAAIERHAAVFQRVAGLPTPEVARETLRAKMVGRWSSGVPLILAPTHAEMLAVLDRFPLLLKQQRGQPLTAAEALAAKRQLATFNREVADYRYGDDPEGMRCPLGSHVRRANPRDMLDPAPKDGCTASTLTNRRRILRRGLPYGETTPRDEDEHGVFIMALCASLFRQFEFVQQQWMQYGLDLDSGNDTCPITGSRGQSTRFVIPADPASGRLPYVAAELPQFVETRGGDYFFIPSLTALRMIAMGEIDPT
ncbi:hypothetical protein DOO78_07670 [Roseicella frigidaeris]|uniref:DyP dimeric alpha+beta barrel domain-containing protein n=2 Tax=Roseicella frigidaeris TaxID=2230885 RepID=A0A327MBE9_9PROT|nr:hypothetical protein DOO78_07670 [Roseicella frigidaeris]